MSTDPIDEQATVRALHEAALRVRTNAHAPYSGFRVGVAVLDEHGDTWLGCNVENAAYPEGCCAETAAIAAMVAGGGRLIRHIAVAGGRDGVGPCSPCGGCRQRISEFADSATRVWLLGEEGELEDRTLAELLPDGFRLEDAR